MSDTKPVGGGSLYPSVRYEEFKNGGQPNLRPNSGDQQLGGAVGAVELIDASPGAVWLRLIAGSGFGHGDGRCGFGVSKNPPRSPLGKGGGKRRFVICT